MDKEREPLLGREATEDRAPHQASPRRPFWRTAVLDRLVLLAVIATAFAAIHFLVLKVGYAAPSTRCLDIPGVLLPSTPSSLEYLYVPVHEACVNTIDGQSSKTVEPPTMIPEGDCVTCKQQLSAITVTETATVAIPLSTPIPSPNGCLGAACDTLVDPALVTCDKDDGYYDETYRPQHGFSSESSWLNDPNGLVYFKGKYHMFYQYNPFGDSWASMHWGHAVSTDLVHWKHLPIALFPDSLGDIWSGSAVIDTNNTAGFGHNAMIVLYTCAMPQMQCLAYSTDEGLTWTKYKGNPVIPNTEYGDNFRDPKVFWHEPLSTWVMVVGPDTLRIFHSKDLKKWKLKSNLLGGECPDLYKLNVDETGVEKWVIATDGGKNYVIGDFNGTVFKPNGGRVPFDYGTDFYATQTWSNIPASDGRRIALSWIPLWPPWTGWPGRGSMTIPRVLTLKTVNGKVQVMQQPVAEMKNIRQPGQMWKNIIVKAPRSNILAALSSDSFELIAEFNVTSATASRFGIHVRVGGSRRTTIGYDVGSERMFVDRRESGDASGGPEWFPAIHYAPMTPRPDGTVRLHMFVDRSNVEVFGNDGAATITDLIFPKRKDTGFGVYIPNGHVTLTSLEYYPLAKIWGCSPFVSNLRGPWQPVHGNWIDTILGKQGRGWGDNFILSSQTAGDFKYEGDLTPIGDNAAVALVFRADEYATRGYVANIDAGGDFVKLFSITPVGTQNLAIFRTAINSMETYHLEVHVVGSNIKVFFGSSESSAPIINVTQTLYDEGLLGLNVFSGTGAAQNLKFTPL
ncbi:hypothetical protein HDU67_005791 [Dinochytrium kinnereticum]|nr:hypothetical protein HDU67_005791 [Dinochytrium kinnereticum]